METQVRDPVKIAIVGLGRDSWSIHVEVVRNRADFRIVDLADPNEELRP